MTDLSRTFSGAGRGVQVEGESVTEVHVPPVIMPVIELCRPMISRFAVSGSPTIAHELSHLESESATVAAAGAQTDVMITRFVRGLYRLVVNLAAITTGAVNASGSGYAATVTLADPGLNEQQPLATILPGQPAGVADRDSLDGIFHFAEDGFSIVMKVNDPVTALSVIRATASVYVCRLL